MRHRDRLFRFYKSRLRRQRMPDRRLSGGGFPIYRTPDLTDCYCLSRQIDTN